jgi:muconolactone delta-isomerase
MEFLVTMTTRVPDGTPGDAVDRIRTREEARSRELATAGELLRLWRAPRRPDDWRSIGLFSAPDLDALENLLASMPLRVWRSDDVAPLSSHPNDPAHWLAWLGLPARDGAEFLTTSTVTVPQGTPWAAVDDTYTREAQRAHELAEGGRLLRLWALPDDRPLALWCVQDRQELDRVVATLPVAPWMAVETTTVSRHPSDPGVMQPRERDRPLVEG